METQFSKLNPMLSASNVTGHYLSFDCPNCKERISIDVNLNGQASNSNTLRWGLSVPDNDWSKTTITPSVANHPSWKIRGSSKCHFSVIDGQCYP